MAAPGNKDGFKCIFCDHTLAWEDCANCADVGDYEYEDTATVYYLHCPRCGRSYEIWDPPREEREGDYKDYWG